MTYKNLSTAISNIKRGKTSYKSAVNELFWDNKEFIIECLKVNAESIGVVHESFYCDKEIIKTALDYEPPESSQGFLKYASFNLNDDFEFAEYAIRKKLHNFYYVSERLKNNRDFVDIAFSLLNKDETYNFFYTIGKNLMSERDFVLSKLELLSKDMVFFRSFVAQLKDCFVGDKELWGRILEISPSCIDFADWTYRDNKEYIIKSLNDNIFPNFKNFSGRMKNDLDVVMLALEKDKEKSVFSDLPYELKNNYEVALHATKCALKTKVWYLNSYFYMSYGKDLMDNEEFILDICKIVNDYDIGYIISSSSKRVREIIKDNDPIKAIESHVLNKYLGGKLSKKYVSNNVAMKTKI